MLPGAGACVKMPEDAVFRGAASCNSMNFERRVVSSRQGGRARTGEIGLRSGPVRGSGGGSTQFYKQKKGRSDRESPALRLFGFCGRRPAVRCTVLGSPCENRKKMV